MPDVLPRSEWPSVVAVMVLPMNAVVEYPYIDTTNTKQVLTDAGMNNAVALLEAICDYELYTGVTPITVVLALAHDDVRNGEPITTEIATKLNLSPKSIRMGSTAGPETAKSYFTHLAHDIHQLDSTMREAYELWFGQALKFIPRNLQ